MDELSPGVSRAAALGLLLVALFVLVFAALLPLRDYYAEKDSDVERAQQRLLRYQGLLSSAELIDREERRIAEKIATEDLFLRGDKPAIVAANLQEFIDGVIRSSGGQPGSSQEYKATALPASRAIGLRLSATSSVRELVDILYQLENNRPLIFVEGLSIKGAAGQKSGPRRDNRSAPTIAGSSRLNLTLDVVGYMPGEEE